MYHNFNVWLDDLELYTEFQNNSSILKRIQVYRPTEDPSTNVLKTREELCDEFQKLANEIATKVIGVKVC